MPSSAIATRGRACARSRSSSSTTSLAQARHRGDSSSCGAGASPSQNGIVGACPARPRRARARFDARNAIRRVAELEDVAREAFDREVLVDRADELPGGSSTTS
jgi:hypothetical protein